MAMINIAVVGHSFVRRGTFSLAHRFMNFDLDEQYQVTFISRGGLQLHQLYMLTWDIVNASRDVVFIDIGTNDLATTTCVDVGDEVLAFTSYLTVSVSWLFPKCFTGILPFLHILSMMSLIYVSSYTINTCSMPPNLLTTYTFGHIKGCGQTGNSTCWTRSISMVKEIFQQCSWACYCWRK